MIDEHGHTWYDLTHCRAPTETEVMTGIYEHGKGWRNVQSLTLSRGLWFHPDMSMYVYYQPTHWRPIPGLTDKNKLYAMNIPLPKAEVARG
jgi:hypothetical protein